MSVRTPLARLCEYHRVALEYSDIWGRRHRVAERTQRALLEALGVPAGTDEAAEQALAATLAADWHRPLPPVQVVWEDERSVRVAFTVPADRCGRYRWTVIKEDGGRYGGEFRAAHLELSAEQVLDGETRQRRTLVLPPPGACGYHRLLVEDLEQPGAPAASLSLIAAPRTCYQPEALRGGGRVWGPNIQLYAVRSSRNWGIGDFTDLLGVLEFAAEAGAGLVGLNPLHALFPDNPAHASPYGPSSRLFLNVLYIDVEAVPDFAESEAARRQVGSPAFQARLRALRAAETVDYPGVAAAKTEILERLYRHFRDRHLAIGSERAAVFRRFQDEQGEALRRHALYEALQRRWQRRDPAIWGWPVWPEPYRQPGAEAVAAFAAEHAEPVEFFEYLQWQAFEQLRAAGRRAFELGLGVGLYQDIAVGVDAGGAEVWANQELFALEARVGSPPDDFNPKGQDWGLPPWRPARLRERGLEPFIATLRQNMRSAGAVRIDHVMGLMRLFWVPPESPPAEGTYVLYPFEELLGILALESQRNQCLVIGEDLGTVPDEVRSALGPLGVLSCRLLYFEKAPDGGFKAPGDFAAQALVAATTHDLPTLAGYWRGRDIELRRQLDLFPDAELREQQVLARAEDRVRLLIALEREGLLPAGASVQPVDWPEMTPELAEAVHRYLARTPAKVMAVQLEDVLGQVEQINLPGTIEAHPNWCRKLRLDLASWAEDPRVLALVRAIGEERGSAAASPPQPVRRQAMQASIPRSTYRVQFHRDFDFDQGASLAAYLDRLGVSHCYSAPCLQARPGSTHGYDIIDHATLNGELGGDAAFARFAAALRAHEMGQIMDMVPNHMGVMGRDNAWWLDVLENGPASVYAEFFDIDWTPLKSALRGKVLIPVLGDHYGAVLEGGELELTFDAERGAFCVRYHEHEFPVDPRSYPEILGQDLARLEGRLGADDPRLAEFQSLITAFGNLPGCSETGEARVAERMRDKEVHKGALARACRDADIARFLDELIDAFKGPAGAEHLHALLEGQPWRLAYWRVASDEINYRRFFDINDLAALRMENPRVFAATHRRVLELIASGAVQGLRIDHPDGLYEPAGYFRRLQSQVAPQPRAGEPADEDDREARQGMPLYLLVEKILAGHERLRPEWAVHGTTGYDFANLVNGLFVDAGAEAAMDRIYREFIGEALALDEVIYGCKKLIMRTALASELNVLAQELSRLAELDHRTRDFTLNSLREALSEIVAWFPVYRTYVGADGASEDDRRYVDWAVGRARTRSPAADTSVFDFVHAVLLLDVAEGKSDAYRQRVAAFAMKFQQYTAPVMAKGVEDTAFYRYNRLISLNEVGGEPQRFGVSVAAFHRHNLERAQKWPHTLLSTSTHDGKRSEDVRARIDVLSELPDEWRARLRRWKRLNRNRRRRFEDGYAPSANDEYLLYQTLVGAWPLESLDETGLAAFRERIKAYMLKAIRESKVHTSWINPDPEYEAAVADFVERVLGSVDQAFVTNLLAFQQQIARAGLVNGLSQTLLKLTSPGVPDIYQGNELWDFSLVDPDNRRPVDYGKRRALLEALASAAGDPLTALVPGMLETLEDGRAKLYLIWRSLCLRREYPQLFSAGAYSPLEPAGEHADHLCAFTRRHGRQLAATVAPRLVYRLCGSAYPLGEAVWGDTWIDVPAARWENWLTGERLQADALDRSWRLPAARILDRFPVALLRARENGE